MRIAKLIVMVIALNALYVNAHPGRTNKQGCHHDRKAGTYHCH